MRRCPFCDELIRANAIKCKHCGSMLYYVLMPNHFHLLVQSVQGNLSRSMQELLGSYTQELNQKHCWG